MDFMAKIMAFFMSIVYFFGSFGLGSNPPVEIQVQDELGNPVAGVTVYYHEKSKLTDDYTLVPIGETDENGLVEWENQPYGEQDVFVATDGDAFSGNTVSFKITVSRTGNDVFVLTLPEDKTV